MIVSQNVLRGKQVRRSRPTPHLLRKAAELDPLVHVVGQNQLQNGLNLRGKVKSIITRTRK